MKNNKDRLNHFREFSSPTPDEFGYQAVIDFQKEQLKNNPKLQKEIDEKIYQALCIARTQAKNGIGFLQDKELRFFHAEYNDRIWKHGLGSLPSSFNILEGFFKWNSDLFYFELIEEEEYLFSLFDFVDFLTSKECSNSLDYFVNNTKDDLIYNYNILNQVKEITYSTLDSKEYVIGGVSFVKRENEVFMILIAGEIGDIKKLSRDLPNFESIIKNRTYLKPADNLRQEAVKLFGLDDIWKVNIYIRIDLEKKTIDSRYIQKDAGNNFITVTDDYDFLQGITNDKDLLESNIKKNIEEINLYTPIFEAAYNFLFLPEYFDFYSEYIAPEEQPTGLFHEVLRKNLSKRQREFFTEYNSRYFFKTKDVWILDRKIIPLSKQSLLKQTELKIEQNGYWKYLEPGKVGKDKNGSPIHSRTWVEETLSWYESVPGETNVYITIPDKVSQNKGYIYMMRNPAHELDIFKIGLTTKTVEERASQLSGTTSSPDKFLIVDRWETKDCALAEKLIHKKLEKHRINPNREFFKISSQKAIKEIIPIIEEINNK